MSNFKALTLSIVAAGGLALAGCEKRAPSADQQGRGYTASTDPAPAPAPSPTASGSPTTAPGTTTTTPGTTATTPSATDDRQNVAGREMGATAGASDLYWVDDEGKRAMIHDSALLTQIQQRLSTDGYYRGPNDGRTSPELAAAIRQFQAKKGLAETGTIDRRTAEAMGLDWSKLSAENETLGEKADRAGAAVETKAGELGREVEAGAKDIGRDLESGAQKVEGGAREVGRDVEAGAKEAGRDLETGAQKVGSELEKGANEAGRKIDESVK